MNIYRVVDVVDRHLEARPWLWLTTAFACSALISIAAIAALVYGVMQVIP